MDVEQIIAAIARETGVRIDRTDPILAAGIVNQLMLDRALAQADRQMKMHTDRVVAASAQSVVDAEKKAEALLSEGGVWAEDRIKEAGQEAAALVLFELRQETAKAERASRIAIRAAWTAAAVGFVTLSGMLGMVLAALQYR